MTRFSVHLGLLSSFVASLCVLLIFSLAGRNTVHVAIACVFLGLAIVHLVQRRRTVARLAVRLVRPRSHTKGQRRPALSDLLLAFLLANVLASGIWDDVDGITHRIPGLSGGPGYHGVSGLLLLCYLVGHVVRRRRRIRTSVIR